MLVLFNKSAIKQRQFLDLLLQVGYLWIQNSYLRILHPLHSLQTSTRSEHGIGSSWEKRWLIPLRCCLHERLKHWRVDRREYHTGIQLRLCVIPRRWGVISWQPVTYSFHSHHSINTPLLMYFMWLCLHRISPFPFFLKVYSRLTVHISYCFIFKFEISHQIHLMFDSLLSYHLIPGPLRHQTQRRDRFQM
jgi:hypothetical protein